MQVIGELCMRTGDDQRSEDQAEGGHNLIDQRSGNAHMFRRVGGKDASRGQSSIGGGISGPIDFLRTKGNPSSAINGNYRLIVDGVNGRGRQKSAQILAQKVVGKLGKGKAAHGGKTERDGGV